MARPQKTQSLGYLGEDFQMRLIKIFLEDKDSFKNDLPFINQNAFTNTYYKIIVGTLKDYVQKYDYIPSYEILNGYIASVISSEIDLESTRETLKLIKNYSTEGLEFIKDQSIKFFKQQELVKFFNENIEKISQGKDVLDDDLQERLNKILSIGKHDNTWTGVYDNFEETFSPESVIHIPIGCKEIDDYLQGGIIKGNLVIICAASGVGKTSISTALAESAATHRCDANNNEGFKVLQIYFEDNHRAIRRKHMGFITEIEAMNINTHEYNEQAKKIAENYEHKELITQNIRLGRFKSGQLTPQELKQYINLEINKGFKPDMIIIDYFECLANPVVRNITNEWKLETEKMRQLENMVVDFDIALVTTTQGTKESMEGKLLKLHNVGGSAGKVQVGHMIMTLNRTEKDAETNFANIFIPKNREGKSGKAFRVSINNGTPRIIYEDSFDNMDVLIQNQKIAAEKYSYEQKLGINNQNPNTISQQAVNDFYSNLNLSN